LRKRRATRKDAAPQSLNGGSRSAFEKKGIRERKILRARRDDAARQNERIIAMDPGRRSMRRPARSGCKRACGKASAHRRLPDAVWILVAFLRDEADRDH
jgi:hypothetical protein